MKKCHFGQSVEQVQSSGSLPQRILHTLFSSFSRLGSLLLRWGAKKNDLDAQLPLKYPRDHCLQKSQYKDGIKNENDITSSDSMDIQTEKRTEWLKLITHLPHCVVGRISTKRPKWSPLCHLVFSPIMQNREQW